VGGRKKERVLGQGEYSAIVSLSTICSPWEIKEQRVVHILIFGGSDKKKRGYKEKT